MAWTEAHGELFKKIDQEMDAYIRQMIARPSTAVYSQAPEIAAMVFCYSNMMKRLPRYSREDVEPLLKCEKPLEAIRQCWLSNLQDHDYREEFDNIICDNSGQEESSRSETGPSMC